MELSELFITLKGRLRHARIARGLDTEQLGELCGVTSAGIRSIETGRTKSPQIDTIDKLAKGLNVNPAWLAWGRG